MGARKEPAPARLAKGSLRGYARAITRGLAGLQRYIPLAALILTFSSLMTYLCLLRYENFLTLNWDLGINQQMLWSTTHGRILYEAGDFELYGVHSFLQVHSTYIAIPLALVYGAYPSPVTLFAIQSGVFGLSAVPLYLVAARVLTKRTYQLLIVGVYLFSFPVVSALFYDFHWEAFLPLEFLLFYYLVDTRRYALSLIPLAAGVVTLEVFPFLAIGVVCYAYVDRVQHVGFWLDELVRDRDTRILTGLLILALGSYILIREAQYHIVPGLLGIPSVPVQGSQTPLSPFAVYATLSSVTRSGVYWLLLIAAFAMLPLLAPRQLILSTPWIVYSVVISPNASSYFGDQSPLIAIAPLAVAAVYGLGWIERRAPADRLAWWVGVIFVLDLTALVLFASAGRGSGQLLSGTIDSIPWLLLTVPLFAFLLLAPWRGRVTRWPDRPVRRLPIPLRVRHAGRHALPVALLTCAAAFSLAMSPMNPANFDTTPFAGYHGFYWSPSPAEQQMSWLLSQIPAGATILVSDNLFPFEANDVNAYAVTWYHVNSTNLPYFPFSPGNLPKYMLLDSSQLGDLPSFLAQDAWNESDYGVVAFIYYDLYPGNIYLFEEDSPPRVNERLVSSQPRAIYYSGANLSIGASGAVRSSVDERFGVGIFSVAAKNPLGTGNCIWFGPYADFLPGNYTVTVNVSGGLLNASLPPSTPVLTMNGGVDVANIDLYSQTVSAGELSAAPFVEFNYSVSLNEPFPLVEFRGYLDYRNLTTPAGYVVLNYIEVSEVG